MRLNWAILGLFCNVLISISARAELPADVAPASGPVIFDMDTLRHQPGEFTKGNKKIPAGTVELVEGKFGKAVKFTFVPGASGGFMTGHATPTPEWDKADGFSFWVKGDGSSSWGGLELIDRDDYSQRYGYCFPIDSTEWRKITVRWIDLTPELAAPPVDLTHAFKPSRLANFFFGKWFYWRDFPGNSFTVDQVAIESKIVDEPNAAPIETGLRRVRAKLEKHQPITIVTMGDSLTDDRHWSNRKTVWHRLLAQSIKAKYGVDVKVVNPAIGGTTLSQNLVLMPRWSKEAEKPDLVTVWFGGNDWGSNVRGPRFTEYLRLAVDRIRHQTQGSADILLMTTCPSYASKETMKEMEEAVRAVAAEKKTGLADVAAAFRKAPSPDEALKQEYWAWDKVHLGTRGHEVTQEVVLHAIEVGE